VIRDPLYKDPVPRGQPTVLLAAAIQPAAVPVYVLAADPLSGKTDQKKRDRLKVPRLFHRQGSRLFSARPVSGSGVPALLYTA
jgi:hypothetical protein